MSTTVDNTQDTIDSRDIIERAEHLADEHHDMASAVEDARNALTEAQIAGADTADESEALEAAERDLDEWEDEYLDELQTLRALTEEAEPYAADWEYGAILVRDSYFKEYAQELAEEIGSVPRDQSWPAYCIDWDYAVRELKQDYTEVDFDGVAYWVRG